MSMRAVAAAVIVAGLGLVAVPAAADAKPRTKTCMLSCVAHVGVGKTVHFRSRKNCASPRLFALNPVNDRILANAFSEEGRRRFTLIDREAVYEGAAGPAPTMRANVRVRHFNRVAVTNRSPYVVRINFTYVC